MSLQNVKSLSIQTITKLSADDLLQLQDDVNEQYQMAKHIKDMFQDALHLKYQHQATAQRLLDKKETGIVRFMDADVQVSFDLPKRVNWNQGQLDAIAKRIAETGDPKEYLNITYKVSESKYNAWLASIKNVFSKARTVKAGTPIIKLTSGEKA